MIARRWVLLMLAAACGVLLTSMVVAPFVDSTWPDRVVDALWFPVMISTPLVVGWGPMSRHVGPRGS